MKKIYFLIILLLSSCSRLLYKESQDGIILKITSSRSAYGVHLLIEGYDRKTKGNMFFYQIGTPCKFGCLPSKTTEKWRLGADLTFLYAVTDTLNNEYWAYGAKVISKKEEVIFTPVTDDEKRFFKIATEKIKSDSCKKYALTNIIGFVNKWE